MASETLEYQLEGHDMVKECPSLASETLESHAEIMILQKYGCPWLARDWNVTLRAVILQKYACPYQEVAGKTLESHVLPLARRWNFLLRAIIL